MPIPKPDTLTAQWFSEQLQRNGFDAEVSAFSQTRIGTGQVGMCIRYQLQFAAPTDAPASLIGKFPSDDPQSAATGVMMKNYLKEVTFYRELDNKLNINTPRCFYAEIEGEGPEFLLLLEDMAPAEQGDQLSGCDERVALAAVRQLVGLHAPSWNDRSLLQSDWLGQPSQELADMAAAFYRDQIDGFLKRYNNAFNQQQIDLLRAYGESTRVLPNELTDPFSLIHIDYRLDNLLINNRTPEPEITVVDWQCITVGDPLSDVGFFIGAGMLAEQRRVHEESIVRGYHNALLDAGVKGFDWDSCWTRYRRNSMAGIPLTVISSMLVQQTERGDRMFTTMAQRHTQHALDLNAGEFL